MAFKRVPVGVLACGRTWLKMRSTASGEVIWRNSGSSDLFKKYMSIPSASCAVQIGVMDLRAAATSLQERPAMLPESSMRKMVSKVLRKAKGSSVGEPTFELDEARGSEPKMRPAAGCGGAAAE